MNALRLARGLRGIDQKSASSVVAMIEIEITLLHPDVSSVLDGNTSAVIRGTELKINCWQ